MQSGLYVTLSAQVAIDRRLATIAANVANQSTPGYRAEEVRFKSLLSRAGDRPVAYSSAGESYISRRPAIAIKTDNPLDVSLQGEGWIALQTPAGTVYTRDGRMRMNPAGGLESMGGYPVLDAGNAPILLNPDAVITQNAAQIGAIGLFSLDAGAKLRRYDNSGVISDLPASPILNFSSNGFAQGFIEGANVNPLLEMAKLIMISRTFQNIASATEGSESSLTDAIKTLGSSA